MTDIEDYVAKSCGVSCRDLEKRLAELEECLAIVRRKIEDRDFDDKTGYALYRFVKGGLKVFEKIRKENDF